MRQLRTNSPLNRRLKTPFRHPTIGQMTFSMAQLLAGSSSREADRGDICIWSHRRADEAVCQPVRNLQASVRPTKHPVSQTGVHCEPAASSPQSTTAPELCGLNGQSCGTRALGAQWGGYPGIQPFTGGLCAHGWTVQQWTHAAKALMAFGLCVTAAGTFRNQSRDKVLPVNSAEASYLMLWKDFYSEREAEVMEEFVLKLPVVSSWLPSIKAMNVPLLSSCPPCNNLRQKPGKSLGAFPAVLQI